MKEVDLEGRYENSDIKSLKFDGVYPKEVLLYPNPTKNNVNILLPEPTELNLSIDIYSIQGVLLNQFFMERGLRSVNYDVSNLEGGQYFLKIGSVVRRFVVVD